MGPFISAGALEFYLWENIAHYYELRYPSYTIVHYHTLSSTFSQYRTLLYTIVLFKNRILLQNYYAIWHTWVVH